MNKREAKRRAYHVAYSNVQLGIDSGSVREIYPRDLSDADYEKIETALDEIAQQLFERGEKL